MLGLYFETNEFGAIECWSFHKAKAASFRRNATILLGTNQKSGDYINSSYHQKNIPTTSSIELQDPSGLTSYLPFGLRPQLHQIYIEASHTTLSRLVDLPIGRTTIPITLLNRKSSNSTDYGSRRTSTFPPGDSESNERAGTCAGVERVEA